MENKMDGATVCHSLDNKDDERRVLHTLEALDNEEFKEFKWFLHIGCFKFRPIPRSLLEERRSRSDTLDLMSHHYGLDIRTVTMEIYKEMKKSDLREQLMDPTPEETVG